MVQTRVATRRPPRLPGVPWKPACVCLAQWCFHSASVACSVAPRSIRPLDEVGHAQAERAASYLIHLEPSLIISSDLERAVQTAEPLAKLAGMSITHDERLRETNAGDWQGLTHAEIRERFGTSLDQWSAGIDVRPGGGETRREVADRVSSCVNEYSRTHDGQTIVIVTHGGSARAGIGHMLELPEDSWLALGVLATACQKRFQILSAGGHVEPLSLFLLPALNPGERKTAAKNLIVRPIETFERQLQAAVGDELRENESKRQTAFKRIEHLRGVAAKDKDASAREIAQREIDELEREMPPARYKPQLICDDCTPEHVATLLSRNGERMAVLSDEAGIFDLINGRYSAKGPNLDVFLQSHAGSQVRVDRGSRESVLLHNPAMTVCCSVQPYVLQELGANRAFKGRGLVARFLFAMPKSRLGFRTLQPKQVPERVETQWSDLVQSLLNIPQHHDEFNGPTALTISLSPEAYQIWKQEQRQTEKEMCFSNNTKIFRRTMRSIHRFQ